MRRPPLGTLFGWILLGEHVYVPDLIGIVLVAGDLAGDPDGPSGEDAAKFLACRSGTSDRCSWLRFSCINSVLHIRQFQVYIAVSAMIETATRKRRPRRQPCPARRALTAGEEKWRLAIGGDSCFHLQRGLPSPPGAMMEMVTVEELDTRLRIVESEIAGEKLVTRHVLMQAQHNADDLAEIKTQLRHFGDDMVLVKAAQVAQGGTLNILVQDVAALRTDATELRRGQEAINARLDAELGEMNRKLDAGLGEMNHKLDAILAAVSPHDPA